MSDDDKGTDAAADKPEDAAAADKPADRTFSQAELDKIVQERVARAKSTPPADYEDLKTKAAELDKLQEAQKTELEKAQERAEKAERDAEAAAELVQRTKTDSAIVAEAAKRGADTDVVVSLLDRSAVEFDSDGAPTNIADAVDALLKAKPFLVTGATRGSADQGAREGGEKQIARDALKDMSHTEIIKAQKEGRLDHMLGRG